MSGESSSNAVRPEIKMSVDGVPIVEPQAGKAIIPTKNRLLAVDRIVPRSPHRVLTPEQKPQFTRKFRTSTAGREEFNMMCVEFPDGSARVFERRPVPVEDVVAVCPVPEQDKQYPTVALLVNNQLKGLNGLMDVRTCKVAPVTVRSEEGMRVYRKSVVFLASMALQKLFPTKTLVVEHAIGASYFCCIYENGELDKQTCTCPAYPACTCNMQATLTKLDKAMRDLVKQDLPIIERNLQHEDAVEYFTSAHLPNVVSLLKNHNQPDVLCHECGDYYDIWRRPLVPRTGMLTLFALQPYAEGLLIRFPAEEKPLEVIPPLPTDNKILEVYHEHTNWGQVLRNQFVGQLNKVVESGQIKRFIALAEALQQQRIVNISNQIYQRRSTRLILIAGPSSSCKTTFARKMMIQLEVMGLRPLTLSVDNYYKPREECPKDENGKYNFETPAALRLDLLEQHLMDLFAGKTIQSPIFDFHTGKPKEQTKPLTLPKDGVVIMEGIMMLNPIFCSKVPAEWKFKIFIAPLSQINLDEHSYISSPTVRLLRIIVRDYLTRGYSAVDTMSRWKSVRKGEHVEIWPFMHTADAVFNSFIDYELGVLKGFAYPLISSVEPTHPVYHKAQDLKLFLKNFHQIDHDLVPSRSLLREFIGGSYFADLE